MIPRQIKALRKGLHMTQVDFAESVGVSFATVNRWERGHCVPLQDRLARIQELRRQLERSQTNWKVYLLKCSDGTLYCGATNDLQKRIWVHGKGKGARYTRGRLPVHLKAWRGGLTKSQALKLECRVKKAARARKEDVLLKPHCPQCGCPV